MPDFDQLTVGDETARAYVRIPDGARAGVVVLHARWGLNEDVIAYADRLAEAGFAVIAPDMFRGQIATEPEDAERLSNEGDAGIAGDVAWAAIDRLADELGPGAPIGVLGWSFGAAYAIWAPSVRERARASVAYYGTYYDDFIGEASTPLPAISPKRILHLRGRHPQVGGGRTAGRVERSRRTDIPARVIGSPSHRAMPIDPKRPGSRSIEPLHS